MIKTRMTAFALAAATALTPLAAQAGEIEWLQWFAAENTDGFYDELVADFEAKHPDITVKLVTQPFGKVRESIVTDSAIGVGSDVLGLNMPWTKEFLDIGILEPLDDYLARDDNSFATGDLVEAPLGKIDGHTWMVPLNAFPFVMHVNMGLVREAGFDAPPATWAELSAQTSAISALQDGTSGIGMPFSSQPPSNGPILTFLPLLYANGGRIMDDTTPNFDNPKVVETLQYLKDMNDAGGMAPGAASRTGGVDLEEFIAGRTGFLISPGVHSSSITSRNPELDYTLVRVPSNGENAYRVHGWEIGISADSANKEDAWTFVNYLLSPEVNARAAKAANALPGNLKALDAVREGADETLIKQMDILSGDTPVEEMRQSPKAVGSWSVMTEEIQAMLRGDQTPAETATAVQARWIELAK
ncbi:sugar ABC transporter substrate-binding protein [Marinovum sp. 2_MG-2023]|uniref:ABC transporter substrate-binding protein n=1 Tax=unclassified Marinovum TaxID=2647166 RepID=UPI0026E4860C|nr:MULTISPECIES: sugar ABC transporter substrate-binding protein [unclassified Marinovum]MDO6732536.1 sugar ABC transporter substrate-binding protein [Marinovum sp. 2_MG-2023]MDO6781832.1 sugar ABC transporter substrate-binding protein [Marinovum sp. 1_MG-2023]